MEFIRRLFRTPDSQPRPSNPRLDVVQQQAMELLARRTLVHIYTRREDVLADRAAENQRLAPAGDPAMRRFIYELGNHTKQVTGEIVESGEEQILSYVVPRKRAEIHVQALRSAKAYWEQTLGRPDNPTDVIMLGRRRLTQIAGKLEKLDPNPK